MSYEVVKVDDQDPHLDRIRLYKFLDGTIDWYVGVYDSNTQSVTFVSSCLLTNPILSNRVTNNRLTVCGLLDLPIQREIPEIAELDIPHQSHGSFQIDPISCVCPATKFLFSLFRENFPQKVINRLLFPEEQLPVLDTPIYQLYFPFQGKLLKTKFILSNREGLLFTVPTNRGIPTP